MGRVARSRSTASAHLRSTLESVCSGLRPLHGACRSRRCQHHLTGLASLVRQCRASRHTRTHLPSRPVRPCFRRCGPAASLLCTDTHSIPLLRWLTPLRSCAPHSMPSRFTAHKGQSGGHARAFAPHEVAWLAQWPQYRAPLAVVRGDFPPKAHYRTAYSEKSKRGARSALHRAGGGSSDRKEEKFPLYPFLIADLSACYDFDYWKIVENCKNLRSESMKPSLNFSLLSALENALKKLLMLITCRIGKFFVYLWYIMGTIIFILLAIVVMSAIKLPPPSATSGELTAERRRQLRRAARRARESNNGGLPWFGKGKRNRQRTTKYYWDS